MPFTAFCQKIYCHINSGMDCIGECASVHFKHI